MYYVDVKMLKRTQSRVLLKPDEFATTKNCWAFEDLESAVEYISTNLAGTALYKADDKTIHAYGDLIKDSVDLLFRYIDAYEELHPGDRRHFDEHPLKFCIPGFIWIACGSNCTELQPIKHGGDYLAIRYTIREDIQDG